MISQKMENCIDACYHCATKCLQCENAYQSGRGHRNSIRMDCAEMCLAVAKMLSSKSQFSAKACALCAEICEECAKECKKSSDIPNCKGCQEACLRCADECRKLCNEDVS